MKKLLNLLLIASFSIVGCYTSRQVSQSDNYDYNDNYNNDDVTYQTFYDQLQPYGNWINNAEYGNIWQPNGFDNFRPYETGGHWVSTVDGWAWASDYNWGWAPFHYGRWLYDQSIGWAWVPGYEWAPAWVTWGQYNDYYAWAPLAPGIDVGYGNSWRAPSNYWSFVPRNYINYSNLNRYALRNGYNTDVNNITIINNYNSYNQRDYYHRGPDYREVERFTHRSINPVNIATTQRPGPSRVTKKELEIYRPARLANVSGQNGRNETRRYNGAVRQNPQTEGNISQPNIIRRREDLKLSKVSDRNGLSDETNNSGNVSRESLENGNRRLQQHRIENLRNDRNQGSPADNMQRTDRVPLSNPELQQNSQQNNLRQRVFKQNQLQNAELSRPQPAQLPRSIQQPAFPQQSERTMRPAQNSGMPTRPERREVNPVRNMQVERLPNRAPQRP